jgi:Ca-activated chloride channel family protein
MSRQVVIVTDAEVSDAARILALVRAESKAADRRRVSVLCIDAAPNSYLTNELARVGGGIARYLTSSPEEGDVTTALDDILAGWVQPVLTGLRLEVNRPTLEAPERQVVADAEAGLAAVDLGDLVAGRSIWEAGRVPTAGAHALSFRLVGYGDKPVESATTQARSARNGAIKALFGAWKVLGLEALQSQGSYGLDVREGLAGLGYDADAVLSARTGERKPLYAENQEAIIPQRLHELLVRESLEYGVLCSATGFVAVRKEAGKQIEATAVVPNALPAGWDEGFVTSAPAPIPHGTAAPLTHSRHILAMSAGAGDLAQYQVRGDDLAGSAGITESEDASKPGFMRGLLGRASGRAPRSPRPAPQSRADGIHGITEPTVSGSIKLFAGVLPAPVDGKLTLFDSSRGSDARKLAGLRRLSALRFRFEGGAPADLNDTAELHLYVDDLTEPVVRVRLVDILRQGGTRPINVALPAGARVIVLLVVGDAAWARSGPTVEVEGE